MQRKGIMQALWKHIAIGALLLTACAAPLVNFYSVDRHVDYNRQTNFDAFVLRQLETMKKGVEIGVALDDLPKIRRGFRRWLEAIRKTNGVVYDPNDLITEYRLLSPPRQDDKISQIVEFIANKTADLFSPVNENRRKFYAKRVNLALRKRQDQLLVYFVRRP